MTDETKVDVGRWVHPFVNISEVRGITRRDWLAGLAMQGIMSNEKALTVLNNESEKGGEPTGYYLSKWAYKIGDAMITEGKK